MRRDETSRNKLSIERLLWHKSKTIEEKIMLLQIVKVILFLAEKGWVANQGMTVVLLVGIIIGLIIAINILALKE